MSTDVLTGGCQCGGVTYRINGPARQVWACHCEQCRRMSGHFAAATACAASDLELLKAADLRWYASSNRAERGFCGVCGSSLFWRRPGGSDISVFAGSLDQPTGLSISRHIYVKWKGDYYPLEGSEEQTPEM